MAENSSPSRSSPVLRPHTPTRPSPYISNPNVFSDEYALEDVNPSPPESPVDSIPDTREILTLSEPRPAAAHSFAAPAPRGVAFSSFPSRPSSISKPSPGPLGGALLIPRRAVSSVSNADSGVTRTSTASSRLSIPRSQSPYAGATGPSHPYGLYPQVTRASSIASDSTIRPLESAFVAPAGPEHPYSMFPQNTVDEEHEDALAAGGPVGFPGTGQPYVSNPRAAGHDVADLVGSDGHVEELPPYTRYADNVVPKVAPTDMPTAVLPAGAAEIPMSPASQSTTLSDSGARINMGATRAASDESSGSFKEKFKAKSRRRVCCGIPLWFAIAALVVIVAAAALGGAIGTAVTRHEAAPSSSYLPAATTTVYLDGSPIQSAGPYKPIPSGAYTFPTDNLNISSDSCISDPACAQAWGCFSSAGLPVYVTNENMSSEPQPASISFESYQVNGSFSYGPQPPSLPESHFALSPFIDNDATGLGPALFFSTLYSKLVIVHEEEYGPFPEKRSALETFDRRAHSWVGQPAQIGDKPWFCYFPDTVLEMFIYVYQNSSATQTSEWTGSPITSSAGTSATSQDADYSSIVAEHFSSYYGEYPPGYPSSAAATMTWPPREKAKRSETSGLPDYPRVVKIIDKRKPCNNTQPYCQQMLVNSKSQLVTLNVPTQTISELEPSATPAASAQRRAVDAGRAAKRAATNELDSFCFCEFFNP